MQIKKPLKFIVDTGSVNTTLPECNAREVGVDMEKLENYKIKFKVGGIGGATEGRMLGGVRLVFTTTDGSSLEESPQFVQVLKNPIPRDEEERKKLEALPSLLGLDIIRRFTLRFEKNLAYLER